MFGGARNGVALTDCATARIVDVWLADFAPTNAGD
jgi:hypothetical protein